MNKWLSSIMICLAVLVLCAGVALGEEILKGDFRQVSQLESPRQTKPLALEEKVVIYYEDFEPDTGWSFFGTWKRAIPDTLIVTYSDSNCITNDTSDQYFNNADEYVYSPIIPLSNTGFQYTLSMDEWYEIEYSYDYGEVLLMDYATGTMYALGTVSGSSGAWLNTDYDISMWAGKQIRIVFHFVSDATHSGKGWYIDHLTIDRGDAVPAVDTIRAQISNLDASNPFFVSMDVRVDSLGIPLRELQQGDFTVYEGGDLQTDYFLVSPPTDEFDIPLADVLICYDNSISGEKQYNTVANNVQLFVDNMVADGVDLGLGLCTFGQFATGLPILQDDGQFTTEPVYFMDSVWSRNSNSGWFEPGFFAMDTAARGFAWRPGAQRIAILISDEPPTQGGFAASELVATLQALNVRPYFLTTDRLESYFTPVVQALRIPLEECVFNIFAPWNAVREDIGQGTSSSYRINYYSSTPVCDGFRRTVEIRADANGRLRTDTTSYMPCDLPKIVRTDSALNYESKGWAEHSTFNIRVIIEDDVAPIINAVTLWYRNSNSSLYFSVPMYLVPDDVDIWEGVIPAEDVFAPGMDYYLSASDGVSRVLEPPLNPVMNPYSIAILPNEPPTITHTPPTRPAAGVQIPISATVTDNGSVQTVTLAYRRLGEYLYTNVAMVNTTGSTYSSTIPGTINDTKGCQYYLYAEDASGIKRFWRSAGDPYQFGGPTPATVAIYPRVAHTLPVATNKETTIEFRIHDAVNIVGVESSIQFDPTKVTVVSVLPGAFLKSHGGTITDSSSVNSGTGLVNIKLIARDTVVGVNGDGVVATITIRAAADYTTGSVSVANAVLHQPAIGVQPVITEDGEVAGLNNLLGDFDNDLWVDFDDYVLLASYWNKEIDDLKGDIAGIRTGASAALPPWSTTNNPYQSDGAINFDDQVVFSQMYNWCYYQLHPTSTAAPLQPYKPVVTATTPPATASNGKFTLRLTVDNAQQTYALRVVLKPESANLQYLGNNLDAILTGANAQVASFDRIDQNTIEITRCVLGESKLNAQQTAELEFYFKLNGTDPAVVAISEIDLRNGGNQRAAIDPALYRMTHSVLRGNQMIPSAFALGQNYPNPFNPTTMIAFALPTAGNVQIDLFNLMGQKVMTLVNREMEAGAHTVAWNGKLANGHAASSGIYLYRIQAGRFVESKKMMLLK